MSATMSCTLRAIGESFDVEAFLGDSPFSQAAPFHRKKPRAIAGFTLSIGGAGVDELVTRVGEATDFLRAHEDELRRLSQFPGVGEVCLEFGIPQRDSVPVLEVFPAELLWQLGALDIDLVVTHRSAPGA